MKQKHLESRPETVYGANEVDLLELLKILWREKILIVATTLVFVGAALFYNPGQQVQYKTVIHLKPAPLSLYGDFVAEMENSQNQSITLARFTSEQVMLAFIEGLIVSPTLYFKGEDIKSFRVEPKNKYEVILQLVTYENSNGVKKIDDYLKTVSDIFVEDVNALLPKVGITGEITRDMLFAADEPAVTKTYLGENKKDFMLAVSALLGGMLGVFLALIRTVLRNRKEAAKQ